MSSSVRRILDEHFDIRDVRGVDRTSGGILGSVSVVRQAGRNLILKRHRSDRRSALELNLRSLDRYREAGIPTETYLPTNEGTLVAHTSAGLVTVAEALGGVASETPAVEAAKAAMRLLARMHRAGRDLRPVQLESFARLPVQFTSDRATVLSFVAQAGMDGDVLGATNAALVALDHLQDAAGEPFQTQLHGDYRPCNVMTSANAMVGLFDWDLMARGPRLYDVEIAVDAFAPGDATLAADLFDTYCSEAERIGFPVSRRELALRDSVRCAVLFFTELMFSVMLESLPLKPDETGQAREARIRSLRAGAIAKITRGGDLVI